MYMYKCQPVRPQKHIVDNFSEEHLNPGDKTGRPVRTLINDKGTSTKGHAMK